jgi:short-subunit dehydrogenase involved in D-alanine esterification of teichoic acids
MPSLRSEQTPLSSPSKVQNLLQVVRRFPNRTSLERIVSTYPDLDCVFLNSGIQSQIRLSRPEEVDLDAFHEEMSTNFNRLVDLSVKFLTHLKKKSVPNALIITGTLLAQIPAVTMPAYSASKAALTAYVTCLRRQNAESSTKIIELWPPVVQSKWYLRTFVIWCTDMFPSRAS